MKRPLKEKITSTVKQKTIRDCIGYSPMRIGAREKEIVKNKE